MKIRISLKRVILITSTLLLGGCFDSNYIEPQIHYIPINYMGEIQILMDQSDGKEIEYLNGSRVYRIPKSGILRSKFKVDSGWIRRSSDIKYYYVDSLGNIMQKLKNCSFCTRDSIKFEDIGVLGSNYHSRYFEGTNDVRMLVYSVDSLWNKFESK